MFNIDNAKMLTEQFIETIDPDERNICRYSINNIMRIVKQYETSNIGKRVVMTYKAIEKERKYCEGDVTITNNKLADFLMVLENQLLYSDN